MPEESCTTTVSVVEESIVSLYLVMLSRSLYFKSHTYQYKEMRTMLIYSLVNGNYNFETLLLDYCICYVGAILYHLVLS